MTDKLAAEKAEIDLNTLCTKVKRDLGKGAYRKSSQEIRYAMYLYPHAPEPHNLMGILLERQHQHELAMRHFRAALDLDPTYSPARENLIEYARFGVYDRTFCFSSTDCREE